MNLASIPSPSVGVWHVLGIPIRGYALCIVLGIVVACWITETRMRRRGAPKYAVLDVAVWAVPFGIVGARLYHVITSPQAYFGEGGHAIKAFYIWEGGLGIWGGVAGGALGAWIACRQLKLPLRMVADALAPGLPVAQAVGRFGNWFNNELYGGPTTLPWGLQVHDWDSTNGRAQTGPDGQPLLKDGLYHPTFLYEAVWNIGVAGLVLWAERRFKLGWGRAFALYVMGYTAGRVWIEAMRTDPANEFLGVRINVWTSIVVFLGALAYFVAKRGKPQEKLVAIEGVLTPVPLDWEPEPETASEVEADVEVIAEPADEAGPDAEAGPAEEPDTEAEADESTEKPAPNGDKTHQK
ncbi:prolipoprotein diacylglyceryl transferase [Longispora fulva]|uniref:Phosphatidylglycerol--prolipoprotein diacylglyceryl transferase n=1 Tax=Longispora fulva TaxID=619741 RepID=A0A8J7GQ28_9ACTN|nr:prolipoprotein diacylglyceryl transferase [Longispora fulva]MBG6141233.1 prolipoprotein diacylglyceryl transferase [Longispora fulva]GIG62771.1 prolipoprotein diacylglyceryl transferase [Longispora fulva]